MANIQQNWERVRERVAKAANKVGRNPDDVTIVAVAKTFPSEFIRQAVQAGVVDVGENRVQEAWQKYRELGNIASWHLVGHLQTNKVKRALQIFDVIHSVDSLHLAEEISRRCEQMERDVEILLEVKTTDEPVKYGVAPKAAEELAAQVAALPRIKLSGLMTMGKWTTDENEVRNCFQMLARLREEMNTSGLVGKKLSQLSMGMSGDFEWAIEEGATMVRIGTAIFGPRPN